MKESRRLELQAQLTQRPHDVVGTSVFGGFRTDSLC